MNPYIYTGLSTLSRDAVSNKYTKLEYCKNVINIACETMSINENVLLSATRQRKYTEVRQILCKILYDNRGTMTLQMISKLLNRDHSTILHSVKTCNDVIKTNPEFKDKYNRILKDVS